MNSIRKLLNILLDFVKRNKHLNQVAQYAYLKLTLVLGMPADVNDRLLFRSPSSAKGSSDKRPSVAFICDEMTWQDFHTYADSIFLHPKVWKKQLEQFQPDMLFCESAWSGIEKYPNVWRGRIYRDRRVNFENRDVLQEILEYCRSRDIPTVFWNKEDPAYFDHPVYDFTDTALQFDHVFTTAAECIEHYRAKGHSRVSLLPFGVNTDLFYPEQTAQKPNSAMFAGSWFSDHPERCKALEKLLDYAIARGWELDIYDRYSNSQEAKFRFPDKYTANIHPAVPFRDMPKICRSYQYALNVNTVVNSPTMISRRILQLAASGVVIVSNGALAFDVLKDCLSIRYDELSGLVFAVGIPEAIGKHSAAKRFQFILEETKLIGEVGAL